MPKLMHLARAADPGGVCMDGSGADYSAVCAVGFVVDPPPAPITCTNGPGPGAWCAGGGAADDYCSQGTGVSGAHACDVGSSNVAGCSVGTGATG